MIAYIVRRGSFSRAESPQSTMTHEAKRRRVADEWVTFYSKSKNHKLRLLSNFADLPVGAPV